MDWDWEDGPPSEAPPPRRVADEPAPAEDPRQPQPQPERPEPPDESVTQVFSAEAAWEQGTWGRSPDEACAAPARLPNMSLARPHRDRAPRAEPRVRAPRAERRARAPGDDPIRRARGGRRRARGPDDGYERRPRSTCRTARRAGSSGGDRLRRRRLVALAILIAAVVLIVVLVVRGCGGSDAAAATAALGMVFVDGRLLVGPELTVRPKSGLRRRLRRSWPRSPGSALLAGCGGGGGTEAPEHPFGSPPARRRRYPRLGRRARAATSSSPTDGGASWERQRFYLPQRADRRDLLGRADRLARHRRGDRARHRRRRGRLDGRREGRAGREGDRRHGLPHRVDRGQRRLARPVEPDVSAVLRTDGRRQDVDADSRSATPCWPTSPSPTAGTACSWRWTGSGARGTAAGTWSLRKQFPMTVLTSVAAGDGRQAWVAGWGTAGRRAARLGHARRRRHLAPAAHRRAGAPAPAPCRRGRSPPPAGRASG